MKSEFAESGLQDGCETLRHQAASVVRDERIVAEVARLKTTPNDLADVDDAREVPFFRSNREAFKAGRLQSFEIFRECFRRLRRSDPRIMQFMTSFYSGKELLSMLQGRRFKRDRHTWKSTPVTNLDSRMLPGQEKIQPSSERTDVSPTFVVWGNSGLIYFADLVRQLCA